MRTYHQIMQAAIADARADARVELMDGLDLCSEDQQMFFKRIYANDNLSMHIDEVVSKMHYSKLDWAMQQVQRTIDGA